MFHIRLFRKRNERTRGQSMIELALLFPLMLILLSGLIEFGFMLNVYLTLMDAARNAARFASDGYYLYVDSDMNCSTTKHFYRQGACLVNQELTMEQPSIKMNNNGTPDNPKDDWLDPADGNDIVISAFSFTEGSGITARHPNGNEQGWSYAVDRGYPREKVSSFTSVQVENSLVDVNAPSTGYVLVEIFYNYDHRLGLPWITAFVSNPLPVHVYAFMPLSSAEPTPTPFPTPTP